MSMPLDGTTRIIADGTVEVFGWGPLQDPDFPHECEDGYAWTPIQFQPAASSRWFTWRALAFPGYSWREF